MPRYFRDMAATARARELRHGGNTAEACLWNLLKAGRLEGHKFVRQHPIGPYFADFANRSSRLVIEIDGSQHVGNSHDQRRDTFLRQQGYSVLRLWSGDVLRHPDASCDAILAVLDGRLNELTVTLDLRILPALSVTRSA